MAWNKASLWTETQCPWHHLNGGHLRVDCERQKGKGRVCVYQKRLRENRRQRDRRTRDSSKEIGRRSPQPVPVVLECSHTVFYRVFTFKEPLWCARCEGWFHQWRP